MTTRNFSIFDTKLGACGIVWTERGIAGVQVHDGSEYATRASLLRRFPGAQEATGDPTQGPVSGAFSAPSDGITVTQWYRSSLEQAGYSTEAVTGPFEDGSSVIDSVGATTACRVQTTIRPLSGTTLVSVRYGAGCLD